MSLADTLRAELLPPCPACSHYRTESNGLDKDHEERPMASQGRAGRRWYLLCGCHHAGQLRPAGAMPGWDTQAEAEQAWRIEAARLMAQHVNDCAALVRSVNAELDRREVAERMERARKTARVAA